MVVWIMINLPPGRNGSAWPILISHFPLVFYWQGADLFLVEPNIRVSKDRRDEHLLISYVHPIEDTMHVFAETVHTRAFLSFCEPMETIDP